MKKLETFIRENAWLLVALCMIADTYPLNTMKPYVYAILLLVLTTWQRIGKEI